MTEHIELADDFGFLKLYDFDGKEVPASREDLLSIEAMSFDIALHRRIVGNRSGRYWLVSDRPGFHAMLLEVSIFHCYPREGDEWQISYGNNGVASYAHWNSDTAINHFREKRWSAAPDDGKPLPANVEEIARRHVTYRLGRTPGPDPLDLHGVRCRDTDDMRQRLAQYTERTLDFTDLLRQLAGKRVAVFELVLTVSFFCGEHNLDGKEMEVLEIVVREDQHARLVELLENLGQQIAE